MSTKALAWTLAGGLLWAASVKAEPLEDLRTRLTDLRSNEPIRLEVQVSLERRGSAPLHLKKSKLRGEATVDYGPGGIRSLEQKWLSSKTSLSLWTSSEGPSDLRLLDDAEAETMANPVETLDLLLADSTVLSDEAVEWEGRPAHRLVVRPGLFGEPGEHPGPLVGEVSIWVDGDGTPLALERYSELGFTGLRLTQYQHFTFQQVDGRLVVAAAEERTQSRTLGVHRGQDTRTMTVSVESR